MLSFRVGNDGKAVNIALDDEGLDELITRLVRLKQVRGHIHLLTPSNGGHELAERTPWGEEAIGEVIFDMIEP